MFYWIYDLPTWLVGLLFTAAFVGSAWIGILAFRRMVRRRFGPEPGKNELVTFVLTAAGAFYGLLLGLIAVATYENYAEANQVVSTEGSALGALYYDVAAYPEPLRTQLHTDLRQIVDFMIGEGWDNQQRGVPPTGDAQYVVAFQQRLLGFEPATPGQEIAHTQTLHKFNSYVDARRERLNSVNSGGLPHTLWWVLGLGAVTNIVLTWLFSLDSLAVHLTVAGLFAFFLGLMVFLIAAMDYPFRGEFSVDPDAIASIRDQLMRAPRPR